MLQFVGLLTKSGMDVTVSTTQAHGDATRIANRSASSYDIIVCMGRDGTLSEVANGLIMSGSSPKLGYIPTGTTNDFAASLKLPADVIKAVETIIAGQTILVDIGKFGNTHYIYSATFGLFSDVAYNTKQKHKNMFSRLAYLVNGTISFFRRKNHEMSVECHAPHCISKCS